MSNLLDIREEVINGRTGHHYISLEDREVLEAQLKELKDNNLLEKNNITYTLKIDTDYILLILHRPIKIFNR